MRDIFFSFVISCLSFTLISCGQTTEEGVASAVSSTSDAVNDTTGAVDNTLFGGTDSSFGSCDNQKVFVVGNAVTEKGCHPSCPESKAVIWDLNRCVTEVEGSYYAVDATTPVSYTHLTLPTKA